MGQSLSSLLLCRGRLVTTTLDLSVWTPQSFLDSGHNRNDLIMCYVLVELMCFLSTLFCDSLWCLFVVHRFSVSNISNHFVQYPRWPGQELGGMSYWRSWNASAQHRTEAWTKWPTWTVDKWTSVDCSSDWRWRISSRKRSIEIAFRKSTLSTTDSAVRTY